VTTNTTLFDGADPNMVRRFFDQMMDLGVEGCMVSPGYAYPKAPDQQSFMQERAKTNRFFEMVLSNRRRRWIFNQSALYLEFLMGRQQYECTPWGSPTYNLFGWQKPCYLLQDGYAETFEELMETTDWERYGRASGNAACQQCMLHCGYEPSAVNHTFGSIGGLWSTIKAIVFNRYANPAAAKRLEQEKARPHGPLAQLEGLTIDGRPIQPTSTTEAA
jgi:hopanoid biosynthesis associated radical SAM protein HpnH